MRIYDSSEIFALIISIIIGSVAYLSVVWKDDPKKITFPYSISVLLINAFLAWIASEIMRTQNLGEYRTTVLPVVAFLGQWITDYIKNRYPKIFDAGFKKIGMDLNTNNDEYIQQDETNARETDEQTGD